MANGLRLVKLRFCLVLEVTAFLVLEAIEMVRRQGRQAFLRSRQLLAVFAAAVALNMVKNNPKTFRKIGLKYYLHRYKHLRLTDSASALFVPSEFKLPLTCDCQRQNLKK